MRSSIHSLNQQERTRKHLAPTTYVLCIQHSVGAALSLSKGGLAFSLKYDNLLNFTASAAVTEEVTLMERCTEHKFVRYETTAAESHAVGDDDRPGFRKSSTNHWLRFNS